jgi:acyl-[acyl carrier protein]--UDP-N-acetylglucosamine O-acyltransferase
MLKLDIDRIAYTRDRTAILAGPPQHRDFRDKPQTWIGPSIADSARIEAYVVISCGTFRSTRIGAKTWIMCGTHVGHDTVIGSKCEISANVTFCGECTVGNNVKIGAGVTVRPRITIGDGAQIGAGAVVVKDVPAGEVWVGNPARFLKVRDR